MPLVDPLELKQDSALAEVVKFYDETLGFCPRSVLTMQRIPGLAEAFVALNRAATAAPPGSRVTSDLMRLIGAVCSTARECRYCQAHFVRAGERYNAQEDKLANICRFRVHDAFTEAERAALELAEISAQVPNPGADDDLTRRLRQHWTDDEITQLTAVASLVAFLNCWNATMSTELEEPAIHSGEKWLGKEGWEIGQHG